jgi:hypothetical protein
MSDEGKTVREEFASAAQSTNGFVGLEQLATLGGAILLRNMEIVR